MFDLCLIFFHTFPDHGLFILENTSRAKITFENPKICKWLQETETHSTHENLSSTCDAVLSFCQPDKALQCFSLQELVQNSCAAVIRHFPCAELTRHHIGGSLSETLPHIRGSKVSLFSGGIMLGPTDGLLRGNGTNNDT